VAICFNELHGCLGAVAEAEFLERIEEPRGDGPLLAFRLVRNVVGAPLFNLEIFQITLPFLQERI